MYLLLGARLKLLSILERTPSDGDDCYIFDGSILMDVTKRQQE